jgi:hypothetical protein
MSPDNYVQSPSNSQNFNRFTYCLGNPLKYNDPSGNVFWIIPSISWSKSGGLNFSLSICVGIPFGANASITVGYGGGQVSFSAGVQLGGAYAYVGYGSKSGAMAGVGYSFSPFGSIGNSNSSISSNIFNIGINWS